MKECRLCKEAKPLTAFTLDKRRPDGCGYWCRSCAKAYARRKYNEDLEKSRASKQAYRDANREALRAASRKKERAWRIENPEAARSKACTNSRAYREANPDYHRKWYEANSEKERERSRLYMREVRKTNPEAERERKRNYRERHAEAVAKREREKTYARRAKQLYSKELSEKMAHLITLPCTYCGATDEITIDHVVPFARGGKHEASNLAPACRPCNSSKSHRLLAEWPGRF